MLSNYDLEMERRRKRAEAMRLQGTQPLQGNMVGNTYVRPNILQHALRAYQGYKANKDLNQISTEQKARNQRISDILMGGTQLASSKPSNEEWIQSIDNPQAQRQQQGVSNSGQSGREMMRQAMVLGSPELMQMAKLQMSKEQNDLNYQRSREITPYQQAQLDRANRMTPYQQAQIDNANRIYALKERELNQNRDNLALQRDTKQQIQEAELQKMQSAAKAKEVAKNKVSSALIARTDSMLNNVDYLLDEKNRSAVKNNLGSIEGSDWFPSRIYDTFSGKDATSTAQAKIDSLKNQFQISNLMKMRDEMGGSVGTMTEKEWDKFQNLAENISTIQNEQEFFKQLGLVKKQLQRVRETHQMELNKNADGTINLQQASPESSNQNDGWGIAQ